MSNKIDYSTLCNLLQNIVSFPKEELMRFDVKHLNDTNRGRTRFSLVHYPVRSNLNLDVNLFKAFLSCMFPFARIAPPIIYPGYITFDLDIPEWAPMYFDSFDSSHTKDISKLSIEIKEKTQNLLDVIESIMNSISYENKTHIHVLNGLMFPDNEDSDVFFIISDHANEFSILTKQLVVIDDRILNKLEDTLLY
jgi:hypothetical protein